MIVACPSCRQRFRHAAPLPAPSTLARCSACDERFPLLAPRSPYRIVRQPVPVSEPVGSSFATRTPIPVVMPPPPPVAVLEPPPPVAVEPPVHAPVSFRTLVSEEPQEQTPLPRPGVMPPPRRAPARGRALGEATVAFAPCAAGAGLAYHFAGALGQDPITATAMGAAVGLLVGWACLLWITRGN